MADRDGVTLRANCSVNLCKNPPSTISSAGSQALNTKMSLVPRLCGAAKLIPPPRDIIYTRQCTSMPDTSDKCLSIKALQGVPAVQPVLTEGSAEMLILYWGDRGQEVVIPERN